MGWQEQKTPKLKHSLRDRHSWGGRKQGRTKVMDHTGTHTQDHTRWQSGRGSLNWGLVARLGKMKDLL